MNCLYFHAEKFQKIGAGWQYTISQTFLFRIVLSAKSQLSEVSPPCCESDLKGSWGKEKITAPNQVFKWGSSNLSSHTHTLTHENSEYVQTNSRLREWREAWKCGNGAVPYLSPLRFTKQLMEIALNPGVRWAALKEAASGPARVWAGPACVQKLPQSDFPTVEMQPNPCPCLKNFLNSIPVLFLTALKPYSVWASMRLCQANSELLGCLQLSMGNTCVKHGLAPLQQRPWRLQGSHSQPQKETASRTSLDFSAILHTGSAFWC